MFIQVFINAEIGYGFGLYVASSLFNVQSSTFVRLHSFYALQSSRILNVSVSSGG